MVAIPSRSPPDFLFSRDLCGVMGDRNPGRRDALGDRFPGGRRAYLRLVGAGLAGAVAGCPAPIDPGPTAPAIEYFARGVALDGETALVGSGWNHEAEEVARGHVFSREGREWVDEAAIWVGTDMPSHHFEVRPALDGDTALIGFGTTEHSQLDGTRSAHVFSRDDGEWDQQAELTADQGGSAFGASVALSGDTVMIGAPEHEGSDGDAAGAAHVFERGDGEWDRWTRLAPAESDPTDSFGSAVAIDGDLALVGDEFDGDSAGAAYAFSRTGGAWRGEAKLVPGDGDSFDRFGVSVALSGDTALVGAYKDEHPNGRESGSAYVFSRNGDRWIRGAKLAAANGDSGDRFGTSVALDGDLALVGAPADGRSASDTATPTPASDTPTRITETGATNGSDTTADGDASPDNSFAEDMREMREEIERERSGAAYVFSRSGAGWIQEATLAADGDDVDRFGTSVALRGETALVGAPGGGGSAYVFVRRDGAWERQSRFRAGVRSTDVAIES